MKIEIKTTKVGGTLTSKAFDNLKNWFSNHSKSIKLTWVDTIFGGGSALDLSALTTGVWNGDIKVNDKQSFAPGVVDDNIDFSAVSKDFKFFPSFFFGGKDLKIDRKTFIMSGKANSLTYDEGKVESNGAIYFSGEFDTSRLGKWNLMGNGSSAFNVLMSGNDNIIGSKFVDIIEAGNGNDNINGGAGADTMRGGLGNDTYIVDNAGDRVEEAASAGTDTVQSSITYTLTDNVENLVLTGTGAINGTGNGLNNTITGNGAANTLDGGAGNDNLNGGGGNDRLIGGNGNDNLNGGAGADTLTGIALTDSTLGRGTIDVLTGGSGNDLFVLGNTSGVFYSDGVTTSAGRGDYAWITDFRSGDKIQLKGRSSDYRLRNETFNGVAGVGLYRNDGSVVSGWDTRDELIGFIQVSGVTLNLGSTAQFTYAA